MNWNEPKELNPLKRLTPKIKPKKKLKYFPTSLTYLPTYILFFFNIFTKIQKCHMAYWYYAMCHNLKPFKLNDEDPLFIF